MTEPEKKAARPAARRRAAGKVVGFTPAGGGRPKVAVTGGSGYLGARFVRALATRGTWDVVVLDLAPAANTPAEVRHRFLDLNLPHSDGTVYKILKEERPDVLVHLAGVRSPLRDAVYAHELNSIGTLNVFGAAGEAGREAPHPLLDDDGLRRARRQPGVPLGRAPDAGRRVGPASSATPSRPRGTAATSHGGTPTRSVAVLRFAPDPRPRAARLPDPLPRGAGRPHDARLRPADAVAPSRRRERGAPPDDRHAGSARRLQRRARRRPPALLGPPSLRDAARSPCRTASPTSRRRPPGSPGSAPHREPTRTTSATRAWPATTRRGRSSASRPRGRRSRRCSRPRGRGGAEGRAIDFGALEEIARTAAYRLEQRMRRSASTGRPRARGGRRRSAAGCGKDGVVSAPEARARPPGPLVRPEPRPGSD